MKRTGVAVLLAWAITSLVILAMHYAPFDAAQQFGAHRTLLGGYIRDFSHLLWGDFGQSLRDGQSVGDEIALRLPRTAELIAAALAISLLMGIPGGLLAAHHPHGALDRVGGALSAFGLAVPVFVTGVLLQYLDWPAPGYVSFVDDPLGHLALLAMPAFAIAVTLSAAVFRVTRATVLHVTQRDFVRAARAKGIGVPRLILHHVLRNALMPIIAVVSVRFGTLLGSVVLVEYVFRWPGLSRLLVEAARARDYPEVQGIVLVFSLLLIALNLAADIGRAALDPRLRAT